VCSVIAGFIKILPFLILNGEKMEIQGQANRVSNAVYDVVTATVVVVADNAHTVKEVVAERFSQLKLWAGAKVSAAAERFEQYVAPVTVSEVEIEPGMVQILVHKPVDGS
jgi:hypothetical protein